MPDAYDKLDHRLRGQDTNSTQPPNPDHNRDYIAPGSGYTPPRSPQDETQSRVRARDAEEYHGHPLHKIYRTRMRGVRARWMGSGVFLGVLIGIGLTLLVSALIVTQIPSALQNITGDPDLAVVIGENYLNRQAVLRLGNNYQAGPFQVTSLNIDLKPDNGMNLSPTFTADLLFTKLQLNASVKNQVSVQNGKLVINMVGDPQLGNLNVPLDLLPFNLKDSVRQAVDKIDNDLLASEINKAVQNAATGQSFTVDGVSTTETSMTIRMTENP